MKRTRLGAAAIAAVLAAGAAAGSRPAVAPTNAAEVQSVKQRGDATPPAAPVAAPSADRAILPLLPYMQRALRKEPIWVGYPRDSGFAARPPMGKRRFRS